MISHENVHDACGHRHTIWKVTHFHIKLHWTNVILGFFALSIICDERLRPEGRPVAALVAVLIKESGNLPRRDSKNLLVLLSFHP